MKVFYDFSAVESSNIRANCWLSSKFLPQFNYFGVYIANAVCHLFMARISFVNMFQQQTLVSLNSKCIWCMWKFCFRTSVMHKFPTRSGQRSCLVQKYAAQSTTIPFIHAHVLADSQLSIEANLPSTSRIEALGFFAQSLTSDASNFLVNYQQQRWEGCICSFFCLMVECNMMHRLKNVKLASSLYSCTGEGHTTAICN